MKRLVVALALFIGCAQLWAQSFTITVTNTAAVPIVSTAGASSVTVYENSAAPTAAFTVVDNLSPGVTLNFAAGQQYVFVNSSGAYPKGTTVGLVQATTTGSFTFVVVQRNIPVASTISSSSKGSGGGLRVVGTITPGNCVSFVTISSVQDAGGTCGGTGSAPGGSPGQLQYSNAGVFGGTGDFTFGGHSIVSTATGIIDLHLAASTGLLLPGALSTGLVKVTTSTGAVSSVAAPAGSIVGTTDVQALTNKDLTGAGNTFPTFNQNTTGTAATITGVASIAHGGTGQTTASAGFNALSPLTTSGDLLYGGTSGAGTRLGIVNNAILTSASSLPAWSPAMSTAGDVLYFNGTVFARLAGNASGTNCFQETSAGVPSWGACGSGGGGTTINPTNTAIPVRSNSTTFIDSHLFDSAGLLSTTEGLSVVAGSTSQVAGSFTNPTGTTANILQALNGSTIAWSVNYAGEEVYPASTATLNGGAYIINRGTESSPPTTDEVVNNNGILELYTGVLWEHQAAWEIQNNWTQTNFFLQPDVNSPVIDITSAAGTVNANAINVRNNAGVIQAAFGCHIADPLCPSEFGIYASSFATVGDGTHAGQEGYGPGTSQGVRAGQVTESGPAVLTGGGYDVAKPGVEPTAGQVRTIVSCASHLCTSSWQTPTGGSSAFPATVSGTITSGGIPYFSNTTTETSSGLLPTGDFVLGGGAGGAPTATFSIVPVANGGSGAGSFTAGRVLVGNGTSAFSTNAALAADFSGTAATNVLGITGTANNVTLLSLKRFTDTGVLGFYLEGVNAAGTGDVWSIDATGLLTVPNCVGCGGASAGAQNLFVMYTGAGTTTQIGPNSKLSVDSGNNILTWTGTSIQAAAFITTGTTNTQFVLKAQNSAPPALAASTDSIEAAAVISSPYHSVWPAAKGASSGFVLSTDACSSSDGSGNPICNLSWIAQTGGSGTINAASQYSVSYYSAAGSATTLSGLAAPTSPSNVPQFLSSLNSSGSAAAPTWVPFGVSGRAQAGTTDTVAATDRGQWVSYSSATAVATTLPQAGSSGFATNFVFGVKVTGAGTVTITPTTSTIDGNATLAVSQGQNCTITSYDNTNYTSRCASGQLTAGTGLTLTPSASGGSLTLTSPVTVALGGTGTTSTLTGLVRGGSPMTAAELSGDATTSGSNAVTVAKINGTAFSGTNGDLVSFGASNTPADSGFLATNAVRKDAANTGAAAMTLNMIASTGSNAFRVPVAAGLTASATGAIGYDSTNGNLHIASSGADAIAGALTGSFTTGNCLKSLISSSNIQIVDAGTCASSSGGGVVTYSGPSLTFSGTQFFPYGGGATASGTEANVDVESPSAATITNFYVQMSVAPGAGNSIAYTWRKAGSSQSLTCTISGASATTCNDTSHSFTAAQGDLLDIQAVTTGTVVGTPTVVMATQFGTTGSNGTVNSGTSGQLAGYSATGTAVSGLSNFTFVNGALTAGVNATTAGTLGLANGGTSGTTITIQNLGNTTAYNFNLPTGAGTSGQPMLSGGGGSTSMTFGTLSVGGGGSGAATFTVHGILLGETTSAFGVTAAGASNMPLIGQGAADPIFSTIAYPTSSASGGLAYGSSTTALAVTSAGTSKQVAISGGTGAPSFIDFPDTKYIPAANCNNATAGAGWSIGSGGTITCRAGTNNLGGYATITDTSSTFAQFMVEIPNDWDTATNPYIRFLISSTDTTNTHTIIPQVKVSCPTAGDGTVSDDHAFAAAHSSSTITIGASAVSNGFYNGSTVQFNSTDMTGCIAGTFMIVQVGRATDTATSANFYGASVTWPRLLTVQAN